MMSEDEIQKVKNAREEGFTIQSLPRGQAESKWVNSVFANFDFDRFDYRVKPPAEWPTEQEIAQAKLMNNEDVSKLMRLAYRVGFKTMVKMDMAMIREQMLEHFDQGCGDEEAKSDDV